MNTNHELVDAVGHKSPVLHKSRAVFDGTVVTRPLSAFGTTCYWASTVACAVRVLPQLAKLIRPVMLRTVVAVQRAMSSSVTAPNETTGRVRRRAGRPLT